MPNWITNYITIRGSPENVKALCDRVLANNRGIAQWRKDYAAMEKAGTLIHDKEGKATNMPPDSHYGIDKETWWRSDMGEVHLIEGEGWATICSSSAWNPPDDQLLNSLNGIMWS